MDAVESYKILNNKIRINKLRHLFSSFLAPSLIVLIPVICGALVLYFYDGFGENGFGMFGIIMIAVCVVLITIGLSKRKQLCWYLSAKFDETQVVKFDFTDYNAESPVCVTKYYLYDKTNKILGELEGDKFLALFKLNEMNYCKYFYWLNPRAFIGLDSNWLVSSVFVQGNKQLKVSVSIKYKFIGTFEAWLSKKVLCVNVTPSEFQRGISSEDLNEKLFQGVNLIDEDAMLGVLRLRLDSLVKEIESKDELVRVYSVDINVITTETHKSEKTETLSFN
ncbi:hypothetical protein A2533_03305 [Candidatus Falkowbacteria bacterium RIFOXYD2_FULL_35_9]|uniref:Uncharacterized protein n=1 Tax=Candidatus Falkowbacteria bacterium RIFOXYC2_FULL_36_12 TaxID=1798002 RepID=A0A1F5SZ22_9BACT|nr:MAG: hypothetical protein A2300_02120 [Candidatus Falkowbacteria bacterium RIFOXYB2_FULL_35_7]OGF31736.1 MAG: hypothetical protein A2478_04595 [Candidatus Falkowbacteria bacterium RIFOXYC2_FULL_36_12]OGF34071.1 MAG: hypothetical protein A2223_04355 [Candidatus Falkowbacteria bacterium RIFOXYA2_FULL_35_8]OGF47734.1 MAG: hypothetical protein A2533_03305 [Candidatus Falkowbacteria bacterium RIFOXYD2_FULL_35_9]